MNKKINYAFIGGSHIALKMAKAVHFSNSSSVISVASKSGNNFERFTKLGIAEHVTEYSKVLEDPRIQVVYVSLPNSLHYEWVKKALLSGKHVLCEKPMVLDINQLEELNKIAEQSNLILMEAMWYRYHPLITHIKQMIVNGDLGRLTGFYSTFNFLSSSEEDIRWSQELGGGAINDLFCYHADALQYLTGETSKGIAGIEGFARFRNGVDASVSVEITYKNNMTAQLVASIERNSANHTLITGEKGVLTIPHLRLDPGISEHSCSFLSEKGNQKIDPGFCNPFVRMINTFSASVSGESTEPLVTPDESIENLKLMTMVRKAVSVEMQDRISLYPAAMSFGKRIIKKYLSR